MTGSTNNTTRTKVGEEDFEEMRRSIIALGKWSEHPIQENTDIIIGGSINL